LFELANLSVCRARLLLEEGKNHAAVELMLDLCQFGCDLGRDGSLFAELYGTAAISLAMNELKDLLCGDKLSPADLQEIDRELEILDASFPRHGYALLGELEILGDILLREQFFSFYANVNRPPRTIDLLSWRYAYSSRLMQVAAFDQEDGWMMRAKDTDLGSWVEEQRVWAEIEAEARGTPNFVVVYFHSTGHGPWRSRREKLAHLRLLRTAAHYHVTGDILELEDPFGTKLRHSEAFDTLKLWSVGKNGTDDGGKGDWKGSDPDDIVLELSR
jgi:hypothetical protein